MLGGKNTKPLGYTVLEVLIVLAISGVMFLIAANFISGKQEKTAFNEGVNQTASIIQSMINNVRDGQYSDVPLNCTFNGVTTNPNLAGSTPKQGENPQCVFLGKVLRFRSARSSYKTLSLAGGRLSPSTAPTLANSRPAIINSLKTTGTLPQGLMLVSIKINGAVGVYDNFGFVIDQGKTQSGSYVSANQSLSMVYSTGGYSTPGVQSSDTLMAWNTYNVISSAAVCLTDGTRFAEISVGDAGSNSNQLAVNVRTINRAGASGCS